MKICLISGHAKNRYAGASSVYVHLAEQMSILEPTTACHHAESYTSSEGWRAKLRRPHWIKDRLAAAAREADVVEVAGNAGCVLFKHLRQRKNSRPLLVTRLHGLEFLDEQARTSEETAYQIKLPLKYRMLTRHITNNRERRAIAASDLVICHSSRDADAIVAARWKRSQDIVVMPLGVDDDFRRVPREHRSVGCRLLWWGSWVERKGANYLPRTFALAREALPDLTLTIGGSGHEPDAILADFDAGSRLHVKVLPFCSRDEHLEVLRAHDVFLFPSLSEGFGLALVEAMAAGLPAITTFTGLANDRLIHGKNCLLVPKAAPTATARAVVDLATDLELRRGIGASAAASVADLTWGALADRTRAAYLDHLHKSGNA